MKSCLLFLLLLTYGLVANPVDLSRSNFFVREGFKEEWVKSDPQACSVCKVVGFTEEAFKSIRIKKVFPEKFTSANAKIYLEERIADNFTIGTKFYFHKLPQKNISYGIFLERIGINWEVYLNGQLLKSEMHIDENGKVKIHKATRFPLIPIPSEVLKQGENYLYFRITGDIRDNYLAVFLNSPEIDLVENLIFRQFDLLRFFIHTSYLVLSFLYFIIFFLHPEQKFNLFFAFGIFLYGIYRFCDSSLVFLYFEDSTTQQNFFSITFLLLSGSMLFFMNYLLDEKAHWLTKLTFFLFCILSVTKLFLPHAYTYPFLMDISANTSLLVYPYLAFYRIGYTGLKYLFESYKTNLKLKIRFPFFQSIRYSWNTKLEFVYLPFIASSYYSFIADYISYAKYDAIAYTSDYSFLIFYGLIAFFTYKRKFQLVEKHNRELEKLNWEKQVEKLQSELALKKERENVFADIHDNIGGKLLDLSIQLNGIQTNSIINLESKEKIVNSIMDVLKGLRSRLLVFEDMHNIEADFADGLKLFLVRRYALANRKISYIIGEYFKEGLLQKENYSILLNLIGELVNNDLKYGLGESNWKLDLVNSKVSIQMNSNTNWTEDRISIGKGHTTIRKRALTLGGIFTEKIDGGKYKAEILIGLH